MAKLLTDERIMHLWDTRVGTPTERYPLAEKDVLQFARAIAEEAVRLEREACAKLCDEEAAQNARMQLGDDYEEAANLCAAAIRARSQEGQG